MKILITPWSQGAKVAGSPVRWLSAQQVEDQGGINVLVVLCSVERHRVGRWRLLASFPQVGLGGPLALFPWFGFAGQPCWLSAVMCFQQVASSLHAPATLSNFSRLACLPFQLCYTQQLHLCCFYCFFKVSALLACVYHHSSATPDSHICAASTAFSRCQSSIVAQLRSLSSSYKPPTQRHSHPLSISGSSMRVAVAIRCAFRTAM